MSDESRKFFMAPEGADINDPNNWIEMGHISLEDILDASHMLNSETTEAYFDFVRRNR